MPEFSYRSLTSSGAVESGRMIAQDERDLENRLRERGEYLIDLDFARPRDRAAARSVPMKRTDGAVPASDLSGFTEYLLSSATAGIPIVVTLTDVETQVRSRRFQTIIAEVRESMTQEGRSLSEAMAEHPKAFPEVFIVTIEAGELTGQLDHALEQLVHYMEWRREVGLQLRQATLYPALILVVLIGLVIVMVVFVYPRLLPVFTSFDTDLPLPTRVVLLAGGFILAYWPHATAAGIGLLLLFGVLYRTKSGRLWIDTARLKIPILGRLIHEMEMSRLVTHLALFVRTGIDLLRGMEMLERMAGNRRIALGVRRARESVMQGDSLAHAFAATGLFKPVVLRALALGEATGRLDETLERTRAYYARELPAAVRQLITAVQPLLIVLVGGTILFVALSIFMPILRIYDSIGP
ncbi:MAG TPA: type II secretion system F family protein [Longimicrobiaceae bacterium]|nr:type II secretion system F family protein [Longimicrobiaceae bacterium]